jgi:superfamily I DNA/RNA helicase
MTLPSSPALLAKKHAFSVRHYVDQVEKTIRSRREKWPNLRPSEKQIREELDFINDTLITTQEQYLDANRAGRGFSLKSAERAEVWQLYQDITGHLRRQGKRLWSDVPRDLCLSAKPDRLPLFQHILIDEAQFFAPAWFELVKLSLAPGGDLFLCADPNQGFMKNRLSWKSAGLDVVGRTRKLRKSYRTTRAILAAATHILATRTQGNPDEFLVPDMEGMEEGQPPVLIRAYSPQDAVDRLVNELAAMAGPGLGLDAALVVYGEEISRDLLRGELGRRFGAANVWCFAKHKDYPPGNRLSPYLRMANLGAATGLEASIVFVLGVDALLSGRTPEGAGPEEAAALREEDARKLYMAMTRAGQRLVLIAREELPENIGKFFISE